MLRRIMLCIAWLLFLSGIAAVLASIFIAKIPYDVLSRPASVAIGIVMIFAGIALGASFEGRFASSKTDHR